MGWNNYAFSIGHQMVTYTQGGNGDGIISTDGEFDPWGYDDDRKPQSKTLINSKRVCPECGKELKVKTNKKTGEQFLGCSGWRDEPRCFFTENIDKEGAVMSR